MMRCIIDYGDRKIDYNDIIKRYEPQKKRLAWGV